ncbi:MAG: DUF4293 domain-containing protein [Bacteroidales bacterium]|nr:DUF4293 domain-containing protein [Bacteroidales bacterium]
MIQRIQSIYLLLAGLLLVLSIFTPLAYFQNEEIDIVTGIVDARLTAFSIEILENNQWDNYNYIYSLGISIALTAVLNIVAIFLFKKRKLQIKLTHYAFILKFAVLAVVIYFVCILHQGGEVSIKPQLGSLFVVIAMVFDWLAIKAIKKDEDLVRSIDRIR